MKTYEIEPLRLNGIQVNSMFRIVLHGDSYPTVRHGRMHAPSHVYVRKAENGSVEVTECYRAGTKAPAETLADQAGLKAALVEIASIEPRKQP